MFLRYESAHEGREIDHISVESSLKKCCIYFMCIPVVGTMPSLPSLQRRESRLVFPAPVRPMHTTSYSGLGGGGPLQHSARKH